MEDEFELEFEELFDELLEDEFELEFEELFELEFDELLLAVMIRPSAAFTVLAASKAGTAACAAGVPRMAAKVAAARIV
ncbi:MAG: hypothetical protein ACRCWF_01720 [Beijerinckiaceae bacterium]